MQRNFIFILCGPPASGKSTLGRIIAGENGAGFVEASDVVKSVYAQEHAVGEEYMDYVVRVFRAGGAQHFVKVMIDRCEQQGGLVVLAGLRHPDEVSYARSRMSGVVVYLNCDADVRSRRKPMADPTVRASVAERDEIESSWHSDRIGEIADFRVNTDVPLEQSVDKLRAILWATYGAAEQS